MPEDNSLEMLIYLMQQAFDGSDDGDSEHQALMPNLLTVSADDWQEVPPGGDRCIREIALHVGACKYMYADHAFGQAQLTWTSPIVDPWRGSEPHIPEVIDWLEAGHRKLMTHVRKLTPAQLLETRPAPWGKLREMRWLLSVLLQHDLYHAGEVNHIRSLGHDDRWAFLQ